MEAWTPEEIDRVIASLKEEWRDACESCDAERVLTALVEAGPDASDWREELAPWKSSIDIENSFV